MKFYGSLIGLAVEEAGKKKVVREHGTEAPSSKTIQKNRGSMNGLTGEFRFSSRRQYHPYGRRKWTSNTCMMKILY
jgi:hypothetical protein